MAKLFVLLVIILGVIALAQLMRVYELSSKLTNKKENEISNRDNRLNAKLMLGFMLFLFIGFIWMMLKYGWTGRGPAASVHGEQTDWLLNLNFVIIILVFFLTNALLFVFAWKYVKKPGVPAFYYPHNNKLEMVWTVIPAVVLAVIIILGLNSWNEVTDKAKDDAIRVELFSYQFNWNARYAGVDNQLGKYDYKLNDDAANPLALMTTETIDKAIENMITGPNGIEDLENKLNDPKKVYSEEMRTDMEESLARKEQLIRLLYQMKARNTGKYDKRAKDDIITDTLYLCKDQNYELTFRSKDVIHSAYIPHLRTQMNTVPGAITRFKVTPNMTTQEMREIKNDEDFNFILMCNKICGGAHYNMNMVVVVMEKEEYDVWMKGEWKKMDGEKRLMKRGKIHEATFEHTYYKKEPTKTYPEIQAEKAEAEAAKAKEAEGEDGEEPTDGGDVVDNEDGQTT
ncbi:MAG: cytochrome c oxidase subunit II [bacterium]|nr:cytochrome c oxidase subunit II [bacterium]